MAKHSLNLDTALFKENRYDGLMICGINSAGPVYDSGRSRDVIGESFFSDERFINIGGDYRRRTVHWFGLFGHALLPSCPGPFERSIVQTNWRDDESPNAKGLDSPAELAAKWDNFAFHIETLQPKLLMFMGVKLLEALNSEACLPLARSLLGERDVCHWEARPKAEGPKGTSVGFQRWERFPVVAFPHPSWHFWTDEYIGSFKNDVSPLIAAYKAERGFAQ